MYQLWAGLWGHILCDTQPCSWIPDAWLSCLRESMHALNIQIQYTSWMVPPSCIGDRYLMEDFLNQNFPKNKLELLNACRMHLQVTTLSEIMDHIGVGLLPQILTSAAHPTPQGLDEISFSTLWWPQSHPLTPACWRIWTTSICSIYTSNTCGMHLTNPLGNWLEAHNTNQFWKWRLHNPMHLVAKQSLTSAT